jgi:hypothetical protein
LLFGGFLLFKDDLWFILNHLAYLHEHYDLIPPHIQPQIANSPLPSNLQVLLLFLHNYLNCDYLRILYLSQLNDFEDGIPAEMVNVVVLFKEMSDHVVLESSWMVYYFVNKTHLRLVYTTTCAAKRAHIGIDVVCLS